MSMTLKTTSSSMTMMIILTPPSVLVPRRMIPTLLPIVLLVIAAALPHSLALSQQPPTPPSTSTSRSTPSTVFTPIQQNGDQSYYVSPDPAYVPRDKVSGQAASLTLTRYLDNVAKGNEELRPLTEMLLSIQLSCKTISNLINRAGLVYGNIADKDERYTMDDPKFAKDGRFYSMRRLDQLSTIVLKNALAFTGKVALVKAEPTVEGETPAEHQPGVLIAQALDSDYVAVLDPLDGSGNADAAICTGTVFGVFDKRPRSADDDPNMTLQEELVKSVLQPAKRMKAAGYCLYSSATVLVFTLGEDVNGFTLDPQRNEFVLTHPKLTIPERGNVYSCNEGNSEGWKDDFKDYLKALKTGKNQSGRKYAHRYVGSMVGDIHRTISYGGIFCYPADSETHPEGNLQLLYKSAPMAFVVSKAGGRAIDGRSGDLLDVRPDRVHQKSPCFMGSPMDINELECYL